MMTEIGLQILLVFMILGALVAIFLRDLLSSVIALGAVGLGLSVAFLLLQAPDLAIVQLVIEIFCIIILIRATIQKDLKQPRSAKEYFAPVTVVVFIGVFVYLSYLAFKELPDFGSPLLSIARVYLNNGLAETGAANLVSAVILNFRALDTLGEATVLFAAVIGTLAVLRKVGKIRKK